MTLAQLLFSQGFGTRRECAGLIAAGAVSIGGQVRDDPHEELEVEGLEFVVGGEAWPYRERALLVMNKPPGHECSQKPRHHPSVYSLLPMPLRRRGVQAVGRLDEDTTGVLLFTDDGQLIHRLTSPRHHVAKVYEVHCVHEVEDAQLARLREGVVLHDDPDPVRARHCEVTGPSSLRLTLVEGKYHQVKRMIAAAGNRVQALHRSAFGAVRVDDLAPGAWRWVDEEVAP
ncbi:MAG TPA: 16S rRNA pseudouridine(516) synthase [Caldimonas sp.]|nr:16S rRNA pseudouridine(516) synthase [Caldimonas sp.]HEX2541925.1 16S rRNA pseudouridine(516) synthase [Caldimonas sp.]